MFNFTNECLVAFVTVVIGIISTNSSDACQIFQRGVQDNSDCPRIIKQIYINEAVVPDEAKLNHSILNNFRVTTQGLREDGRISVLSFMGDSSSSLCLSTGRGNIADLLDYSNHLSKYCVWGKTTFKDKEKWYTKAESVKYNNAYAVKQWGNIFISTYGSDENIKNHETLDENNFLISYANEGPLPALNETNSLENTFNESLDLSLREYSLEMFVYFTRKMPKEVVFESLMKILTEPRYSDNMKTEAIVRLSDFNDPEANKAMLDLYYDLSTKGWVSDYVLRFFPNIEDHRYRIAVAKAVSGTFRPENKSQAVITAGTHKIREAELPIIQILNRYLVNTKYDNDLVGSASASLGEMESERALPVLLNTTLYYSDSDYIRRSAREAVAKIQNAINIKNIYKGDLKAIRWAKELLFRTNGEENKETILKILAAFKKVKNINPSINIEITTFVKSEIASGCHDYDDEILSKLKDVLDP